MSQDRKEDRQLSTVRIWKVSAQPGAGAEPLAQGLAYLKSSVAEAEGREEDAGRGLGLYRGKP